MPAAARMPACLMPPPIIFLLRRALSIKVFGPASIDPTGAHSPLDRQNITESTWAAMAAAGAPSEAAALKSLAPSRWTGRPFARARAEISFIYERGMTLPEEWAFSRQISEVGG